MGRPSVREALAALKRKGLVQINNGERARVTMPSADTIISELSGMAKDFLTQPAVLPISSSFACSLNPALFVMPQNMPLTIRLRSSQKPRDQQPVTDDNTLFIRSDVDFHRVLAEIPGNPIFNAIHVALLDWLIAARLKCRTQSFISIMKSALASISQLWMRSAAAIPMKRIGRCKLTLTASPPRHAFGQHSKAKNNDPLVKQIAI